MRVKFSFNFVDDKGNSFNSNQQIRDVDVNTKGRKEIVGFWFAKESMLKKFTRSDDSVCIVWQVGHFGDIYGQQNALPCAHNVDQLKVKSVYK